MSYTGVLLLLGWLLAAVGYYGPWTVHSTAALTLSGVDIGEFVKFLPGVLEGSLAVIRQLFYLPPVTIVLSVALLVGSRQLHYPWPLRILIIGLAVPVSLQLMPPAWSLESLRTAEFRAQTIALGVCWLALASFWLWGSLPAWLTASLSASLALAALVLSVWQFVLAKPAIDEVYRTAASFGWGFYLCQAGLAITAVGSLWLALQSQASARSQGAESYA
jgi:hypothetical protein